MNRCDKGWLKLETRVSQLIQLLVKSISTKVLIVVSFGFAVSLR